MKPGTGKNKKRILIIDDDKNLTQLVKVHLEIGGEYRVLTENKAKHGLYAAQKFKPDLILLDIIMPQMDGFKVLKALKKDSKTMSIPVIMLTAIDEEQTKIRATEQYGEYYITKSLMTKELKTKINEILKIH